MLAYEMTVVTKVDMNDADRTGLHKKIASIIEGRGGEVLYQETWGDRTLAYPIEKESRAHFDYLTFTSEKEDLVAEIERNLRIHDSVVRYLTIQRKGASMEELRTPTPFTQKKMHKAEGQRREERASVPKEEEK